MKHRTKVKQYKDIQKTGITPEFEKWVKEFMDEHEDVLKELAKR